MIRIERGPKADFLKSEEVDLALEKLEAFYSSPNRGQKRYDFPFMLNIDKALKQILHDRFHGKCGYCEIKISTLEDGVIDRFRPYNGVRDKKNYFKDLYWWLVYEWENLVYSCIECNRYKANYFPISGKRILDINGDILKENSLLLDPCLDKPSDHLIYRNGELHSETDKGLQTIELLNLNRSTLVNNRRNSILEIKKIVDKDSEGVALGLEEISYLNKILDQDPEIEFLFAKRQALLEEIESNPSIQKYYKNEPYKLIEYKGSILKTKQTKKFKSDIIRSDFFPLEYIHIKNFKCITDLKISFPKDLVDKRAWLFILGENAVGKSSILQAFALGIKSNFENGNPIISTLIQKNKQKAEIIIKERDNDNVITTTLNRREKTIIQNGKFDSFLVGYGSLRLASEEGIEKERNLKAVSYENLFNPIRSLNDSTQWLKSIHKTNKDLFNSIAFSIKKLLPHDLQDNLLTIVGNELVFEKTDIPFSNFSDGYKSTITLALDIMMKLSSGHADMDKIAGIVIIDELGNQLHPRWQMRIVNQLRSVFPRITFIISTHHPLCLRGSEVGEVILLRKINNKVEAIIELPDPSTLRVDQLLASEYFGLNSMIDPELESKFNRYYELLSLESKISLDESHELDELKDELRNKKHLGSSLREELMYSVIDNLLAQKVIFSKEIPTRETLKEEVINRVKKIWSELNIEINDQS